MWAKQQRDLDAQKIKYHSDPDDKKEAVKKRYGDDKESIKLLKKYIRNLHLLYNNCKYH